MSMTGPDDRTNLASAREIREHAAAWLERHVSGEWSEHDQAEFDAWMAAPSHAAAYLRVDAAWNRTYRLSSLRRPTPDIAQGPVRRMLPTALKIAAAFTVLAFTGVATSNMFQHQEDRTYSTPLGGRETIAFADGTRIELNTNTVLRARMNSAQRTIWLDRGEAYFHVKHDAAHPFVVIAGNRQVTDLGTAFLMRRDTARLEVAVMQGRVRFEAPSAQSASVTALLTPGDVATATAGMMLVTRRPSEILAHELGWRRGMLIFDNVTLADAVDEFNRYNREKLVIADAAASQMKIGGTFRTSDVKLFARVVQDVLRLRVENRGSNTVISQ